MSSRWWDVSDRDVSGWKVGWSNVHKDLTLSALDISIAFQ
jgi:hypothetical protein